MATYTDRCTKCGYQYSYPASGRRLLDCPCCGNSHFGNVGIEYDSLAEKESMEKSAREERGALIVGALGGLVILFSLLPGTLLLMLLHSIVEIKSMFWNWVWIVIFSGSLFLCVKANLMTHLKLTAVIMGIVTIIAWCVKDFTPWRFAGEYFSNPWIIIPVLILGIPLMHKYYPSIFYKIYNKYYRE